MSGHSSAKFFFTKWIATLSQDELTVIDRKLINILIKNFDVLAPLGTASGKRALRLGQLIESTSDLESSDLSQATGQADTGVARIAKLSEIKIGPFRGFGSAEVFLFDKQYTFLYGPNGSGKSSFCEALEYALLGDVEEAGAKRIPLANYLKNEQENGFIPPILNVRFADGIAAQFLRSDPIYRFCFIEKNRIDLFARMAATSAKDQLQRISSLFGLESYNNFVANFTEKLDDRYLKLKDTSLELIEKENLKLIQHKARLLEIDNESVKIVGEAKLLSEKLKPLEFSGLKELRIFLSGDGESKGKITELQEIIAAKIPANLDDEICDRLYKKRLKISNFVTELNELLARIGKLSSQVNFKELYEAVRDLHASGSCANDVCPACHTPVGDAVENPYTLALSELSKMNSLAELQREIASKKAVLFNAIREKNIELHLFCSVRKAVGLSEDFKTLTEISVDLAHDVELWMTRLNDELIVFDGRSVEIAETFTKVVTKNSEYSRRRAAVQSDAAALKNYCEIKESSDELAARIKIIRADKEKVSSEIKQIEAALKLLVDGAALVRKRVADNLGFQKSYAQLTTQMRAHCETLGVEISKGLTDKAIEFYNLINDLDPDFEKIDELKIPTAAGEKIVIKFRGDNRFYDALQIMSEGHLKCLGLSLLLSKIVSDDLKFIVYDDIVNAIDDNHRDGIATLMLENPSLKERQQIVTCHGEIFINKLNHKLGAAQVGKLVRDYRFTPVDRIDQRGIKISGGESLHYLLQAQSHLATNQLKDAAAKCRQAIEGVAESVWKKIAKTAAINLSVKLRRPGGMPDLDSVITALIKELGSVKYDGDDNIYLNMKKLKEVYNWALLNKGTHEDGSIPEFDRADVISLVALLEKIDSQAKKLKFQVTAG